MGSAGGRGWDVANSPKWGSHREAAGSCVEGMEELTGRPVPQWKGLCHKGVSGSLLSLGTSKLTLEATGGRLVGETPIPERGISVLLGGFLTLLRVEDLQSPVFSSQRACSFLAGRGHSQASGP